MRYHDTGNVHLDFHRTMNGTLGYLRRRYGMALVDRVLRRTAHQVYRAMRDDLMAGNPEHLIEHWTYYLEREGAEFSVERTEADVTVTVRRCPALAYLEERGVVPDPAMRRQTAIVNEALAEGTRFEILTRPLGDRGYVQTIRRRSP